MTAVPRICPGDLVCLDPAARIGEPTLMPIGGLARDGPRVGIVVQQLPARGAAVVGLTLVEVLWSDGSCHSCSTNVLQHLGLAVGARSGRLQRLPEGREDIL